MTLNQLRYFCTASRCHSITKAAEELYVTQPTVSVAIRDLEISCMVTGFWLVVSDSIFCRYSIFPF